MKISFSALDGYVKLSVMASLVKRVRSGTAKLLSVALLLQQERNGCQAWLMQSGICDRHWMLLLCYWSELVAEGFLNFSALLLALLLVGCLVLLQISIEYVCSFVCLFVCLFAVGVVTGLNALILIGAH